MTQPFTSRAALVGWVIVVTALGCERESSPSVELPRRPLRSMESAIRRGEWQRAAEFADEVLEKRPNDPEATATVARVAFENGEEERAADLLVRACEIESYADEARIQQTLIAMVGVGRFHDGIEFLERAIAAQPAQSETRRLLYDLCMGSENRFTGLPHGRTLVQERAFDIDLLTSLSNTERRTQDASPLLVMMTRNPDDKRPLVGEAKTKFDAGEYQECIDRLNEVIAAHPDHLPSQALLGRALATDRRFKELKAWIESPAAGIQDYPEYWVALGDWLRADDRHRESARAYWEATQRDFDWMEPWSKLSTAIVSSAENPIGLSEDEISAIRSRAEGLSRFNLLKTRFERTGKISRATVIEMAEVLRDLGRLWEAEAWAAMAFTLPEDDAVNADEVRESIVSLMDNQTPWQTLDGFAELQLDLRNITSDRIVDLDDQANTIGTRAELPSDRSIAESSGTRFSLQNEAEERGLRFFGRTGDRLNEPGIMLYQTLGCGGGTIDFDRDGWSDLYLAAAGGKPPEKDSEANALMRNVEGRFIDVTTASATGDRGFGQGIAVGDVNEDGFPDVLVLNYGPNTLLVNNGDGTFQDQSWRLANSDNQWSTSGAIADINGDGISDIVVVNYCAGLEPVTVGCPSAETGVTQSCSPMKFDAQPDQFLAGTNDGEFVDATSDWLTKPPTPGRGLGIVAGSFEGTPGIELLVANDMTNNHYWSRDKKSDEFRLTESAMLRGLGADDRALAQGSMGIATGDFDRDGDIDFYVTNFDKEYNTYVDQRSDGIWQDETNRLKLASPTLPLVGFGTVAADLNHDANQELLVTNGHVDIFSREKTRSIYAQPLQLFRRNDAMTFDSIADSLTSEYASTPHIGRALWALDVDRDARVDFAVTHQTEPVAILINRSDSQGRWLELSLTAVADSRDSIGALAKVSVGDQEWTAAQVAGDGYMCSHERILRFGLGDLAADAMATVEITWPNGRSQVFDEIGVDAAWMMIQGDEAGFLLRD